MQKTGGFLETLSVTAVDCAQRRHRGLGRGKLRQRGDEGRRRLPNRFEHRCCTALAVRQGGRPWIGSSHASPPPKVSQTPIRTHELSRQRPTVCYWALRNEDKRRVFHFIPPQELLTKHLISFKLIFKMPNIFGIWIICGFHASNRTSFFSEFLH